MNLSSLAREDMRALYRFLVLTRMLEERLETLFKQGHIVGGLYRSLGQEATAVGTAYALQDGDWLAPSIRDAGALYVRGLPPIAMLRQYTAREASPCAGKDNTNHFTIPELGLLGPISPLGTQLCVLNGISLTFRQRGEPRVCMTYQGEGASRTGTSHEGFAMAAALDLPMVIVLEHNRWSFGTPSYRASAVEDWADTAGAYGLPVRSVDGNDLLQVYEAAREAVERARSGGGPGVIVAETYRMSGHAQHDSQKYIPSEELDEWRARDPIGRFERVLLEDGWLSDAGLAEIRDDVDQELTRAVDTVLSEPHPPAESSRTRVYADPRQDPPEPWTRTLATESEAR
ncbi:MAG: thiamine pyrophosphate-dependent dehydrogenase E1 component subunit alpha [marine benthic group bacterium]|nr:thiamine pyrophosphate-dependent dehydrogenase E1 component subunit alpha [Gemmatimonadota bacterium]MCL7963303.1 thiamine pyrophosphate-dependent dehydrogenase E1 component subunit alpha [Candidatus Carthagonibacter metallireducens]MCL7936992.1 thiamine pyrophosphate-dependent dehydrogenase E1 component subunit alpha [Gemmatimonadota bacterium]MCL7958296.1 thiamine pyrophosphate-dependent dehydrogenase E1 component subunit alpha [Gemmatimonadota bacterium]MCL7964714.1 thiamine pyrophosphate